MPYATQADLVTRYGTIELTQISDLDNTGQIDAARVAQALSDASTTIDGYLAGRYDLPLATVPAVLVLHCCAVARYLLMGTRPTDEARARHEDALAWLDKVAQGRYGLGLDQAGNQPATAGGAVTVAPGERVFDRDTLCDYTRIGQINPGTGPW